MGGSISLQILESEQEHASRPNEGMRAPLSQSSCSYTNRYPTIASNPVSNGPGHKLPQGPTVLKPNKAGAEQTAGWIASGTAGEHWQAEWREGAERECINDEPLARRGEIRERLAELLIVHREASCERLMEHQEKKGIQRQLAATWDGGFGSSDLKAPHNRQPQLEVEF